MGKDGAKAIKDVHKSGTHVPEKDFSSSKKVAAAASGGKKGSLTAGKPAKADSTTVKGVMAHDVSYKEPQGYEGSMKDWSDDHRQAKAKGMSSEQWEDSPRDRLADKAGEKTMREDDKAKPKDAPGYKAGVSAFSNSPKTAHGFGHSGSQKQGHLRTSGNSGAHQIGKRK